MSTYAVPLPADRGAGAVIAATSLLMLGALALHPIAAPGPARDVLAQIADQRLMDGLVHGTVLALYVALLVGFARLSAVLGWERPTVAGGFVCFTLSCMAVTGAVMLDGFVTPDMALLYAGTDAEKAMPLMELISVMIQDLTKLALVAQAVATIAWSLSLVSIGKRGTGAIGIGGGALLIGIVFIANPRLMPHLLMGVMVIIDVWNLAIAALLPRGQLRS